MSLDFCRECCSVEGGREEIEENGETYEVCAACGSPEICSVPEHDDGDYER